MIRKEWMKADTRMLLSLSRAGKNGNQIAKIMARRPSTIYKRINTHHPELKLNTRRPWTDSDTLQLKQLVGDGLTCSQIGTRMSRCRVNVHLHIKKEKITKVKLIKAKPVKSPPPTPRSMAMAFEVMGVGGYGANQFKPAPQVTS